MNFMGMDLKARMKHKQFWLGIAGLVTILIQQLGFTPVDNLVPVVTTISSILVIMGILVDTSTKGICDHSNHSDNEECDI